MNTSFYEFFPLKIEKLKVNNLLNEFVEYLKLKSITGKIVLAEEGVNGMVSGPSREILEFQEFYKHLISNYMNSPSQALFKNYPTVDIDHKRMIVKIKDELITLKQDVNLEMKAPDLEPEELFEWYEEGKDFVLLDVRNGYEYDMGHFQNSIKIDSEKFSELPKLLPDVIERINGRPVVAYCTGGVRCEKATALLKENGVDNIRQLHGGIINYGLQIGNKDSKKYWKGDCFVFDKRGSVDIYNLSKLEDDKCICKICDLRFKSGQVTNEGPVTCKNCLCLICLCHFCKRRLEGCCSNACFAEVKTLKK